MADASKGGWSRTAVIGSARVRPIASVSSEIVSVLDAQFADGGLADHAVPSSAM
jgi:hypothetical protein